jgi:hypothetical protein
MSHNDHHCKSGSQNLLACHGLIWEARFLLQVINIKISAYFRCRGLFCYSNFVKQPVTRGWLVRGMIVVWTPVVRLVGRHIQNFYFVFVRGEGQRRQVENTCNESTNMKLRNSCTVKPVLSKLPVVVKSNLYIQVGDRKWKRLHKL